MPRSSESRRLRCLVSGEMHALDNDAALADNLMSSSKNYDCGNLEDGVDFYNNIEAELCKDDDDVNIISIGIGGSF